MCSQYTGSDFGGTDQGDLLGSVIGTLGIVGAALSVGAIETEVKIYANCEFDSRSVKRIVLLEFINLLQERGALAEDPAAWKWPCDQLNGPVKILDGESVGSLVYSHHHKTSIRRERIHHEQESDLHCGGVDGSAGGGHDGRV